MVSESETRCCRLGCELSVAAIKFVRKFRFNAVGPEEAEEVRILVGKAVTEFTSGSASFYGINTAKLRPDCFLYITSAMLFTRSLRCYDAF